MPVLVFGATFAMERWVEVEAELVTAGLSSTLSCPPFAVTECTTVHEATRLVTLVYGIRVVTPTRPVRGFAALRNGLELDGPYQVVEVGAGAELPIWRRLGLRLEVRQRWDFPFETRGPVAGTAVLVGIRLSGR